MHNSFWATPAGRATTDAKLTRLRNRVSGTQDSGAPSTPTAAAVKERVVQVTPTLMSVPLTGGPAAPVQETDAVAGVAVDDLIWVVQQGISLRFATGLVYPKPISEKFEGQEVGSVGGAPVTVGEDTTLRVRLGGAGTYQEFSSGDVTVPAPGVRIGTSSSYTAIDSAGNYTLPPPAMPSHRHQTPDYGMNSWSLPSITASGVTTSVTHAGFDQPLRVVVSDLRADVIMLRNAINNIKSTLGSTNYTSYYP